MSIKLFKHNQTAYTTANDMFDKVGKAAVIHPTGTGKSDRKSVCRERV